MSQEHDQEWIEFEKITGKINLPEDVNTRSEAFNTALINFAKQLPPTDPAIQTHDEQVLPDVKVRTYTPPKPSSEKIPLLVFIHGGGWHAGNLDTEDHLCRIICSRVHCVVVSVDYRLFPAVKFPVPIDDCYAAYQWAYEHADSLGADRRRFAVCGGSAGAQLAVAVAYKLVSSGHKDRISGLIPMAGAMIHPDVVPEKYKHLHTSYIENSGQIPVVTGDDLLFEYERNFGSAGIMDVDLFPLVGAPASLKSFPRTYIIGTDKEACRDDSTVLEAALKDVGVSVKRDVMLSLPHYFWSFPISKAGEQFRELLVEGIKWAVE